MGMFRNSGTNWTQAEEGDATAASSARHLDMKRGRLPSGHKSSHADGIRRRDETGPCAMSFAQQRLWYLEQLEPGNPSYHIVQAARLKGALDQGALRKALNTIVERHAALRTTFGYENETPVQVVRPARAVDLSCFDLQADPTDRAAVELLERDSRRPFDLSQDLMLRAALVKLGSDEHVLGLTVHHIAFDGWSLGILRRELSEAYAAYLGGHEPALPQLTIQYVDYSLWQREQVGSERIERQLAYWKKRLADPPPVLELPADRPRPSRRTHNGATQFFALKPELHARLKEFCAAESASLYMVLMSAFQALLHRYSGQTDIAVGSPVAGRTRQQTEGLIGLFVNTLVVRGDLSGKPSFRELVRRTRGVALEAYANQEVPFDRVVEALHPDRNGSPQFQTMLALQNMPDVGLELPGVDVTPLELAAGGAKFDLSMVFREREGRLAGCVDYNTDLFKAPTVRRIIEHFETLLESSLEFPDRSIASLTLLSRTEQHQLLNEWNGTSESIPELCVHELIEEHGKRAPNALAVACEDGRLTYGELDNRARQVAQRLCELGVGPGSLVGLHAERSLDVVVGLLGTLKAGAAYVPLDPGYPRERLEWMAADARLTVRLTQSHLVDAFPCRAKVVVLDEFDWSQPFDPERLPAVSPRDLAYVVYTSGSTGKPKGAAIEHRSVVNLVRSFGPQVQLTAQDHLMATASLSFDMGNLDILLPLSYGASFTLASRDIAIDTHRLAAAIDESGTTFMQATPATYRMLLDSGWKGKPDLRILSGGESLSRSLVDALGTKCHGVWNGYGPAEATICCAITKVEAGEGPVPIGRPLANTTLYVLDTEMQLVPVGVRGELYIGGAGLAREYLNRPEITAKRFIANPFGPGRLYKTGDLVRWRPEGQLEFVGRADDQVKVRGFRIELGEIEAALLRHEAVKAACVTVREDTPGDVYLAAYYVARADRPVSSSELREHVRENLPAHMVPNRWLEMDAFPLTSNGKVDRRGLPAPPTQVETAENSAFPQTAMQKLVAEVWEDALGIQGIGVHDNFYDVGGHSLLSVQVIREMENRTGVRLRPIELVSQSLGQIAASYERHSEKAARAGFKDGENVSGWQRIFRGIQRLFGLGWSEPSQA